MPSYEVWAKRTLVEWVSVTIVADSDDLVEGRFSDESATGFTYDPEEADVIACDYEFDHFELESHDEP